MNHAAGTSRVEVVVRELDPAGAPTGLEGLAMLAVSSDAVLLTPQGEVRVLVLPVADLAGVWSRDGTDVLHLQPAAGPAVALHPVREADGVAFRELAARVESAAFGLPELTRALRRLGSRPPLLEGDHDRWFGALLSARRRATRASGWRARLDAFAPDALRRDALEALAIASAERHPASPPDRRALEALLEERAAAFLEALDALAGAAGEVAESVDGRRLLAWRGWVAAVAACFAAADRAWGELVPALRGAGPRATGAGAALAQRSPATGRAP